MNTYLFVDVETSGLPKNYKLSPSNHNNWPFVVQYASVAYAGEQLIESFSTLVSPLDDDGKKRFEIDKGAAATHKITAAMCIEKGITSKVLCAKVYNDIAEATHIIVHNMAFDRSVMLAEFFRLGESYGLNTTSMWMKRRNICTMMSSTSYCKLPQKNRRFGGYKWPKLEELYTKLFNEPLADSHDALVDVTATARCFFELVKLGVIKS